MTAKVPAQPRLFPANYWDEPEIDPDAHGEESVDTIFHAVGVALSTWESAECALASLFQVMSGVDSASAMVAVNRAFGSIESSAGRRTAIKAAAEIYFGEYWTDNVVKEPFNELMRAHERGSGFRNKFAHGMAYNISVNGKELGAFLFPAEYNTQRTNPYMSNGSEGILFTANKAKYFYKADIIYQFSEKFGALRNEVWNFVIANRKVNGIPSAILNARYGEGSAAKIEALIQEQSTK
jgi:hypothetical protein